MSKKIFWSPSTAGFFHDNIHAATQIPKDAVEVSEADHRTLLHSQSVGFAIGSDASGRPIAVASPALTTADKRAVVLSRVRYNRAQVIARLDGLQSSAIANNDMVKAKNIEEAKAKLRAITTLTAPKPDDLDSVKSFFAASFSSIGTAAEDDDIEKAFIVTE